MTALDYLCHIETCQEIIECLTPEQLSIFAMRWSGMNNHEIAEIVGLTPQGVAWRMNNTVKRRILEAVPESWSILEDRKVTVGRPRKDRC